MATVTTPWGRAMTVEEVSVAQRAGDKRFTTRVELLESPGGERLVRLSYATSGSARRGPVTLRDRDLAKLREALERSPLLRRTLEEAGMKR
jgi:hypothetical protein